MNQSWSDSMSWNWSGADCDDWSDWSDLLSPAKDDLIFSAEKFSGLGSQSDSFVSNSKITRFETKHRPRSDPPDTHLTHC